ncbi:MAG: DegT/DnrJ/EryC1/StrS family aminotransferase [Thermoleophilaceae bacterium]|nr:DegT/DnrJ/EryC1/StrS family aminotransferase [Thermoleophilaceae bacterium]
MIPLFDIRLSEREVAAVEEALRSGWLTMGPRTETFERAFADHLGARHAIAVSSGTAALHLACLAAGVGPGDEAIVPAITFVATAAAVRYCGARPVLADIVGQRDLGIDPDHVEGLITPRTRAVVAVHYGGYAADVETLAALCERHGLALIEDAAHSPSATPASGGRKLGTRGTAGAFSFFSNKVLGCGEGGLVATDDDDVARFVRSRRSHAMTSGTWDRHRGHASGYDVAGLGFNYRLDELRAALLHARLPALEDDIGARRRIVRRYRELLAGVPGVTVPYRDEDVEHSSCYVMPVMVDDPELRDPLRELLQERGVQTSVLYPAIHELSAYRGCARTRLPRSELAARTELTLPLYPHLSQSDQDVVVESLRESLASLRAAGRPAAPRDATLT